MREDAGPQLLTILRSPGRVLDVNLDHCTFAEAAIPSLARICLNVRNFSLCQCSGGEGTLGQSFAVHLEDLARGLGRRRSERSGGSSIAGALSGIEPEVRGRERQLPLRLLLRELRLNELGLQDGSAQLLSHALAWLRLARRDRADVEVLELEGNHLTHEGVIALADLLENSPLRRLSLSRNKLRPLGGMCMGDLLAARPPQASWLDLELQRCSLGEGVVHLWQQVLSGNARIRRLNLADNAVDAATVEVLLDAAALSPACPEELELLPNPCGSRVVAKLLHHLAPWRTISLKGTSPEVAEVAQLLSSFGDQKDATCSRDKPSEFVLSLGNTLKVPPGHWELLGDALKVATCPVTQLPGAARPGTAPFRRLGGCGGILYLEFRDCDLSQAFFRVPRAITPENVELSSIAKSARREWSVKAAERMPSAKSLATRARSAAGEDAVRTPSSRAPFRPAPRVADKCQGATEAPGSEPSSPRSGARCPHRPVPPLRVCREENFTPLFERHEHVDLQASSVLRELRNVQGLRLLQCGLTDGWLAKLGHSGSSKWSGVRMLDLRCNQLTSASSSALASVVSGGLQALVLDGNRLQSVGFKAICTALTGKKCALRWLSVANNDLTHPSGSAAAEVLGSACPLQELSLAMNPKISSGEICTLLRAAARSQAHLYLDLAQTGAAAQVLPFAAKALARCEGLVIDLSGCPAIAEGSAEGPNLERFLADQRLLL
ncbi:unnamed protein product [Effrenium voratum]|nr:unnamed protein product [Effrenium voratum]